MTDILLTLILTALLALLVQRQYHHRQVVRWLDSLGDLTGDMLRAILEKLP